MNDLLLRACRGKTVSRTPVWIMRQAGRYLPEYLAVKKRHSFWEMCTIPELTCEVTLQPVQRLDVDAAILFSDILVPLAAMGLRVEFNPGPILEDPVRSRTDLNRLHKPDGSLYGTVASAVRLLRRELEGRVPLIGFAGAPFTLAVYAVEGGASKNHSAIRSMLYREESLAHELMQRITDGVAHSLESQIEAGAQAIQIFDSWAGLLSPAMFERLALPYVRELLRRIADAGVPRIYFAPGAMSCLPLIAGIDAEVVGIDWRIDLSEARRHLGDRHAIQGNLDPGILLGTHERIAEQTRAILAAARGAKGHIMNLGHGILPETPVENALAFIRAVRDGSQKEHPDG